MAAASAPTRAFSTAAGSWPSRCRAPMAPEPGVDPHRNGRWLASSTPSTKAVAASRSPAATNETTAPASRVARASSAPALRTSDTVPAPTPTSARRLTSYRDRRGTMVTEPAADGGWYHSSTSARSRSSSARWSAAVWSSPAGPTSLPSPEVPMTGTATVMPESGRSEVTNLSVLPSPPRWTVTGGSPGSRTSGCGADDSRAPRDSVCAGTRRDYRRLGQCGVWHSDGVPVDRPRRAVTRAAGRAAGRAHHRTSDRPRRRTGCCPEPSC